MKILRTKLLKTLFGATLLLMMLLKVAAPSLSHFSCLSDPLALEKSAEEGKETKEALDKTDKKLLNCVFTCIAQGNLLWINRMPASIYSYKMQIGSHPLRTVPTPPPDGRV